MVMTACGHGGDFIPTRGQSLIPTKKQLKVAFCSHDCSEVGLHHGGHAISG
jgi:hypothetical protein